MHGSGRPRWHGRPAVSTGGNFHLWARAARPFNLSPEQVTTIVTAVCTALIALGAAYKAWRAEQKAAAAKDAAEKAAAAKDAAEKAAAAVAVAHADLAGKISALAERAQQKPRGRL
jgi:hypothetical protein